MSYFIEASGSNPEGFVSVCKNRANESDRQTRNRPTHDQEVKIEGPYDHSTEEFKDFLNNILKEGHLLPWLCTNELRDYVRVEGGLVSKLDDRFMLYRSGVEKKDKDKCFQVLAFLLLKVIETDTRAYVNTELVCRGQVPSEAKIPNTRGRALHDRLQEDMLRHADEKRIKTVVFSLDSVESAMATYKKWGYSEVIVSSLLTLKMNKENGAIPMVKIFVKEEKKWRNIEPAKYYFICDYDEIDFKNSVYPIKQIVDKSTYAKKKI
jgi:hypothetical protein